MASRQSSGTRLQFPAVAREWRRVVSLLKQRGVEQAAHRILQLIRAGSLSLFGSIRFIEYLLRHGEYVAAGRVIKTLRKIGVENPLLDELQSSWLWCIGKRKSALCFALRAAKRWQRPYLFNQVAALYHLMAEGTNSSYYKKKANYFRGVALELAKRQARENVDPQSCAKSKQRRIIG